MIIIIFARNFYLRMYKLFQLLFLAPIMVMNAQTHEFGVFLGGSNYIPFEESHFQASANMLIGDISVNASLTGETLPFDDYNTAYASLVTGAFNNSVSITSILGSDAYESEASVVVGNIAIAANGGE